MPNLDSYQKWLLEHGMCPWCEQDNVHPRFSQLYADDVVPGPHEYEGWHQKCMEAARRVEQEQAIRNSAEVQEIIRTARAVLAERIV